MYGYDGSINKMYGYGWLINTPYKMYRYDGSPTYKMYGYEAL